MLLDRVIKKEFDEGKDFVLSVDAYRLFMEYRFNPYVLASSTKINIFPHQIDEVIKILNNPRLMIADEVGLGKTIIAALVATELRERGLANRTLYVVPKSLVIKWQEELWNRFETVTTRIDSEYLKNNENPLIKKEFSYVASIDFLKQQHIMNLLENINFDLVVVDEAHKLSYKTERFLLGKLLSERTNFLLFLTATPHNGNSEDFTQRMKLLDPYFIQMSTMSHLMTRNIKEDVIDLDGKEVFPPRTSKTIDVDLSDEERNLNKMVDEYIRDLFTKASNQQEYNAIRFLTTIIRKRASSSIFSLLRTLEKRRDKLGSLKSFRKTVQQLTMDEDVDEEEFERNEDELLGLGVGSVSREKQVIDNLLGEFRIIQKGIDSKMEFLLKFLEATKRNNPKAKIVIFSEYRDTKNYLMNNLCKHYKVTGIDGLMDIQERDKALIQFRDPNDVEIMVCTDAAGEGIDMQFCNIEINYDIPWNPNKLEQRMGRIHRIGQDRSVYYYNFVLNDTIDGYIIRRLLDKIEIIKEALGEKIYDVIGRCLVNEEEIASLYEELLRLPKEKWDARIKRIDGMIDERRKVLNSINELLIGHRLDKSELTDIKRNIEYSIDKDQVKTFVEKYFSIRNEKLELVSIEDEIYRIYLPTNIQSRLGGIRKSVLEGTFNGAIAMNKGYTYFALGNPYIMSLIYDAAQPTVAILEHPTENSILLIYKVTINDGRNRERDGKMLGFKLDIQSKAISQFNLKDIWEYKPSSGMDWTYGKMDIIGDKELVDIFAEKYAKGLLEEKRLYLEEIESKTQDSIIRHYSRRVEELNSKIFEYKQRVFESPTFSKYIRREELKRSGIQNELMIKLDEVKDDFKITSLVELVGIGIVHQVLERKDQQTLEMKDVIRRLNEFSIQNRQINSENSISTQYRFQKNAEEWHKYHEWLETIRKSWPIDPLERIILRLKKMSPRYRIGDFGCGKAKIMDIFGKNRVRSFDHVSYNENVTACDMTKVPLEDGYLDVIVFSLSLMGKNWRDYIPEASRCLMSTGTLLIADTIHSLTEGRLAMLKEVLFENGFDIYKEESWDMFSYLEARKR